MTTHSEENGTDEMLVKLLRQGKVSIKAHNATAALLTSALFVAKYLLLQKAVLLRQVCHTFLKAYGVHYTEDIKSVQLILEVEESSVQFSLQWLLHQLIFMCAHIKFGTVLFQKGGDMLVTHTLGSSQSSLQLWRKH